jgi:hypothetical protein
MGNFSLEAAELFLEGNSNLPAVAFNLPAVAFNLPEAASSLQEVAFSHREAADRLVRRTNNSWWPSFRTNRSRSAWFTPTEGRTRKRTRNGMPS